MRDGRRSIKFFRTLKKGLDFDSLVVQTKDVMAVIMGVMLAVVRGVGALVHVAMLMRGRIPQDQETSFDLLDGTVLQDVGQRARKLRAVAFEDAMCGNKHVVFGGGPRNVRVSCAVVVRGSRGWAE